MLSAVIFDHCVIPQKDLISCSGPAQAIHLEFGVRDHAVTQRLPHEFYLNQSERSGI